MKTLGTLLSNLLLLLFALIPTAFWLSSSGVGLWMCMWAGRQVWLDYASTSWPSTAGQILSAEMTTSAGRFGITNFWPAITYSYTVADTPYHSSTIIFGQAGPATQSYAQAKVQQYQVGSVIPVYFDPTDPEQACLEPGGIVAQTYLALGLGGMFLICGLWGLMIQWRPSKRRAFRV